VVCEKQMKMDDKHKLRKQQIATVVLVLFDLKTCCSISVHNFDSPDSIRSILHEQ
jgi:hypothetical protein